ncbi:hypothetical protein A2U01_0057913, partial [Trifolium medium]|nr:hypothetical protein [Trifolium medium]
MAEVRIPPCDLGGVTTGSAMPVHVAHVAVLPFQGVRFGLKEG